MPSNYKRIRKENIREYGEGTKHLALLGKLYTDRTHFIFELLQNAEDAGSKKILFMLYEDRIEVFNNGRIFDEQDVRGICGVCDSTNKNDDYTRIGRFGIGFKSVFAYTSTPEIHSKDENEYESFKIESYVRPSAVTQQEMEGSWTTCFKITFDNNDVEPDQACKEIGEKLLNLSARTLLFLRKIEEIEYKLPDGKEGIYLREETDIRDDSRRVTVIGQKSSNDENETWIIFKKPVVQTSHAENCSLPVSVEVGFRLETEGIRVLDKVVRIENSPLVVFFPTELDTRCGFLIQGPYRTTPARDNIPKHDDWNKSLVRETADFMIDVLAHLRETRLLDVALLEALPIRRKEFPRDNRFHPIFESVRKALQNYELLPTEDGNFCSARNAVLARGAKLVDLLGDAQLLGLFGRNLKWLPRSITQDRFYDVHTYLRRVLNVKEITPEYFASKITESFLQEQSDEWMVKFLEYLSGQEALWRSPSRFFPSGPLRSKPILRVRENQQVRPFKNDDITPNVFLPLPEAEDTDFLTVKRSIAEDHQANNFLRRLGLSEPNVYDDIVKNVLPKYSNGNASSINQKEYEADIEKIFRTFKSASSVGMQKFTEKVKQTAFLKAVDLAGNEKFKKPSDIYFDCKDLRLYFSNYGGVWFLSQELLDLNATDTKALDELGVNSLPRLKFFRYDGFESWKKWERTNWKWATGENRPSEYDPLWKEFTGWKPPHKHKMYENYIHGVIHFTFSLNTFESFEDKKQAALILWEYLKKHLDEYPKKHLNKSPNLFKSKYTWFYRSWKKKYINSIMLECLKHSTWIPTNSGSLQRPVEIFVDDLIDELQQANELIEILGIKEKETPKYEEIEKLLGIPSDDIKFLKDHPDDTRRLVSQMKAEINSKKSKAKFPKDSVKNPKRRKEKVLNQLDDATEKKTQPLTRTIRTTRNTIDPAKWLREKYTRNEQMWCQICKKVMPFKKRNGDFYFEAVEAFSDDYFKKEYEQQFLALCPLCAAKYKEFIKKEKQETENLRETILESENREISLCLGKSDTTIKFVESHFQGIQTAIEYYSDKKES